MGESILFFSGKNLQDLIEDNGIGWWKIRESRAKNCDYGIIIRCLNREWARHDVEHGTARFIVKFNEKIVTDADSNRKCLQIAKYAEINILNAWQKLTNNQRNPIKYYNTLELLSILEIDIDKLEWKKFNK